MELEIGTTDWSGSLSIQGGGTLAIPLITTNGTIVDFELSGVVYDPSSRCSLLFLSMFAERAQLHERNLSLTPTNAALAL